MNSNIPFSLVKTDLFPEGKSKALILSFDDGHENDQRLIERFNRYDIKATFHLTSSRLDEPGYVSSKNVRSIYEGHEVSLHTYSHRHLDQLPQEQVVNTIWQDRLCLEDLVQQPIKGMAYPYGSFSDQLFPILQSLGVVYARTTAYENETKCPTNFLAWPCQAYLLDRLIEKTRNFLDEDPYGRQHLFLIRGHGAKVESGSQWQLVDQFCDLVESQKDQVWFTTCFKFWEYQQAKEHLEISANGCFIKNPSAIPVWIKVNNQVERVDPGQIKTFKPTNV